MLDRYDDAVLRSVFTPRELAAVHRAPAPALRLGVSFGTKEACGKALGTGLVGVAWTDIEALADGRAVHVRLTGAARERARERGMRRWRGGWRAGGTERVLVVVAAGGTSGALDGLDWADHLRTGKSWECLDTSTPRSSSRLRWS